MPRMKGNCLFIEGNTLDLVSGECSEETWCTSKIVTRISEKMVATKKGTVYVLEGDLTVRRSDRHDLLPTPQFLLDRFASGFPENWEQLVSSWEAWARRQAESKDQNRNVGIIFNSTLIAPGFSSASSVPKLQASPVLLGSTACLTCPTCNTVLPPPPSDTFRPDFVAVSGITQLQ